jgi:hypothetical protein
MQDDLTDFEDTTIDRIMALLDDPMYQTYLAELEGEEQRLLSELRNPTNTREKDMRIKGELIQVTNSKNWATRKIEKLKQEEEGDRQLQLLAKELNEIREFDRVKGY